MIGRPLLTTLFGVCLMVTPAMAQQFDSAYTKLDTDKCTLLTSDNLGGSWFCPGYKGIPVYVAEGDLRMFVSYGANAEYEMAAHQTFGPFNDINETLEWRLVKTRSGWKPFATILHFFLQYGDGSQPDGQILVVTSLAPGNTCHVAHIDARRISDANEVARYWADTAAMSFNCARDEIIEDPY